MNSKPVDRRKLAVVLAIFLVVVVAFGLSLTAREEPAAEMANSARVERKKMIEDACASGATFQGLKQLVFDQAARLRILERINFDILAAGSVVRMENPVVRARDEALDLTRCSGRFILELPPGAETAFSGERRLVADAIYEVQAAADGSGPVYRMSGAEGIISRLAAFDMQGRQLRPPGSMAGEDPLANDQALVEPGLETTEPSVTPPAPAEAPPPVASNPSFDCRYARSRSEIMICGSESLAAQDRRMTTLYADAMEDADRRTRRMLVRTRDNFLAFRDRCMNPSCIAEAYEGRMREIRDIMAEAY